MSSQQASSWKRVRLGRPPEVNIRIPTRIAQVLELDKENVTFKFTYGTHWERGRFIYLREVQK